MNNNTIIFTFFIVLLLYYIFSLYSAMTCPKFRYNDIKNRYTNIRDELDTGDLVFFSSDDYYSRCIRKLGNCIFSHVGFVIKLDGIIFILECDLDASYDFLLKKELNKGVHLIQLDEKIHDYEGIIFGYKKLEKGNFSIDKLKKIMNETKYIDFNTDHLNLWGTVFKNDTYSNLLKKNNKMFCSEYMAFLLKEFNVIKDTYLNSHYSIKDFADDFDTNSGYKYSSINYFKFNKEDKKKFFNDSKIF